MQYSQAIVWRGFQLVDLLQGAENGLGFDPRKNTVLPPRNTHTRHTVHLRHQWMGSATLNLSSSLHSPLHKRPQRFDVNPTRFADCNTPLRKNMSQYLLVTFFLTSM